MNRLLSVFMALACCCLFCSGCLSEPSASGREVETKVDTIKRREIIAQLSMEYKVLKLGEHNWRQYTTEELEKRLEDVKILKRAMQMPSVWDDHAAAQKDPGGVFFTTVQPAKCIRCGSENIKPYKYGREAYNRALLGDESFIYGGDMILGKIPCWGCVECHARFYNSNKNVIRIVD